MIARTLSRTDPLMSAAPLTRTPTPRTAPRPPVPRRPSSAFSPALPPLPVRARRLARLKPLADYPLAAVLLVLTAPAVGLAVLLVRATSRGPAIYRQTRVGLGGRKFVILKLRTMAHECESLTGPRWSTPGDPRITPVGKWLRRLHLDELPQLVNVLRGEMSLVGPRPERPEICENLRNIVPGYDRRHQVKPGITGFAQVHLPPDTCVRSVKNKVAYDRFYLLRSGLRMEAGVLVCTLLKVVGLKKLYRRPPQKPAGDE
jgi:lipopolysaccharide/colanic/teichoic acid biosynthesis glycosyltransferase